MELFTAIALLCQVSAGGTIERRGVVIREIDLAQLDCQKSYVHCVNVKTSTLDREYALNRCILERRL